MKLWQQIGAYAAVALVAAALVPVALAGNGGASKGSSSLSLVVLGSSGTASTATPKWGDQVTFAVSTSASYPAVQLACYQGSALVFNQIVGAFPGYAGSQVFTLESPEWSGGSADCTAWLYTTSSSGKRTVLASLAFPVTG